MEEQTIKEKLDFYLGKPIELHIVKKKKLEWEKAIWLNCLILSSEKEGVYLVKERKYGEMYIFASEIFSVEEIREKEDKEFKGSFYQA